MGLNTLEAPCFYSFRAVSSPVFFTETANVLPFVNIIVDISQHKAGNSHSKL
jgi:hypothetical protein